MMTSRSCLCTAGSRTDQRRIADGRSGPTFSLVEFMKAYPRRRRRLSLWPLISGGVAVVVGLFSLRAMKAHRDVPIWSCSDCGEEVAKDAAYCPDCGAS